MPNEKAAIITEEMNLRPRQTAAIIRLLEDGASTPYISRYRRDIAGDLDETAIRAIELRLMALDELEQRRNEAIDSLTQSGSITDDLRARIAEAPDEVSLDDILLPFRPHRANTRASRARDMGLEPLADSIMAGSPDTARLKTDDEALDGALAIIAERISENPKARVLLRSRYRQGALLMVTPTDSCPPDAPWSISSPAEPIRLCPPARYLDIRQAEERGEVKIDIRHPNDDETARRLTRMFVRPDTPPETAELLSNAVIDSYNRLLRPAIASEMAQMAKDRADEAAVAEMASELRTLLMSPPAPRKRIMGIVAAPEGRCALAVIDADGTPIANDYISPSIDFYGSADLLCYIIDTLRVDIIVIPEGPVGRDILRFVQSIEFPREVTIDMMPGQQAAIYADSPLAEEELPGLDIPTRQAVSLARRRRDPMSELVKIPLVEIIDSPRRDIVNQRLLTRELDYAVEQCIVATGVDVNTASTSLLRRVPGIGPKLAGYIVDYRNEHGPFTSRRQLLDVPRMGAKAFGFCGGVLRVQRPEHPLDDTAIHPDSYPMLQTIADDMGVEFERLVHDRLLLRRIDPTRYASRRRGDLAGLAAVVAELIRGNADPRIPDASPSGIAASALKHQASPLAAKNAVPASDDPAEALHLGQIVSGRVVNLTPFGAFIDLGLPYNGLLHISQISDDYISHPSERLHPGQSLTLRILDIDASRQRIALTLRGVPQS